MQSIIYISEKNGSRELKIPWTPEKIHFTSNHTRFASYDLLGRGEVKIPSGSNLHGYSWDGILPAKNRKDYGLLRHSSEEPNRIQGWWSMWREYGTLLHLLIPGTPINHDVYLEDYDVRYLGGFGDYEYSISFIDAREISITVTTPPPAPAPAASDSSHSSDSAASRASDNAETYKVTPKIGLNVRTGPGTSNRKITALPQGSTVSVLSIENGWAKIRYNDSEAYVCAKYLQKVVSNPIPAQTPVRSETQSAVTSYTTTEQDTLWSIAVRFLGNGARWTEIYSLNQSVIESTAQAHGFSSSNNGNRIWGGMKLQIRK